MGFISGVFYVISTCYYSIGRKKIFCLFVFVSEDLSKRFDFEGVIVLTVLSVMERLLYGTYKRSRLHGSSVSVSTESGGVFF